MPELVKNQTLNIPGIDSSKIDELIQDYKENEGNSLTILQAIQEAYGYLPFEVVKHLSEQIGLPLGKLYGVATFYTQFKFSPHGKYVINICHGTACHVNGAMNLAQVLEDELGIKEGETSEDRLFTLERVACLGCCSLSPVMMINETIYGHLTLKKLRRIIKKIKKDEEK